jgi:hypothetical protein
VVRFFFKILRECAVVLLLLRQRRDIRNEKILFKYTVPYFHALRHNGKGAGG